MQLGHGRGQPARGERRLVVRDVGALDGVDPVPQRLEHGRPPALERSGGVVEVLPRRHPGRGRVRGQDAQLLEIRLGHGRVGVPQGVDLLEGVPGARGRRRRPDVGQPVRVTGQQEQVVEVEVRPLRHEPAQPLVEQMVAQEDERVDARARLPHGVRREAHLGQVRDIDLDLEHEELVCGRKVAEHKVRPPPKGPTGCR